MKTVILCGGKGSRIQEVSTAIPKPLLEIDGFPILWHIMKYYGAFGYNDFVLCLGYKSWLIKEFFLNYRARISDLTLDLSGQTEPVFHDQYGEQAWSVVLAETGIDTMTGGRISRIRNYLKDCDHFFLTYGDGLCDVDLNKLLKHHIDSGAIATLTGVRVSGRFGELIHDVGKITSFVEKPTKTAGRVNGGYMVLDAHRVWDYIETNPNSVFEQGPLVRMANDGVLGIFEHDGFWQCMDTPREFELLQNLWLKGEAPWRIW